MSWRWDAKTRRYRAGTGRFLSEKQVRTLRDRFVAAQAAEATALAGKLAAGDLTVKAWETAMRALIRSTYLAEYALGRGGANAMTDADYRLLGKALRQQYGYLRGFARDVAAGNHTEAGIANRAGLYVQASRQAHERGKAAAWGVDLPAYPGDGSTSCKANCSCGWRLSETKTAYRATWVLGGSEHCDDCAGRAAAWSPFMVEKEAG